VIDTFPAELGFVTSSFPGFVFTNGQVTFDIGTLGLNASTSFTISATSDTLGIYTNTATATTTSTDTNLTNNTKAVPIAVGRANVALYKTASTPIGFVTGPITYQLRITNFGPTVASSLVVTDSLPANVSYLSSSLPGSIFTNGNVICSIDSLDAGAGTSVWINVVGDALGYGTNTATVALPAGVDTNGLNNSSEAVVEIKNGMFVISSDPAMASVTTGVFSPIVVTLNRPVEPSSVSSNTILVSGLRHGLHVGTFSVTNGQVTFDVSGGGYQNGDLITVGLTKGVQATNGAPLIPFVFQFSVSADASATFTYAANHLTVGINAIGVGRADKTHFGGQRICDHQTGGYRRAMIGQ